MKSSQYGRITVRYLCMVPVFISLLLSALPVLLLTGRHAVSSRMDRLHSLAARAVAAGLWTTSGKMVAVAYVLLPPRISRRLRRLLCTRIRRRALMPSMLIRGLRDRLLDYLHRPPPSLLDYPSELRSRVYDLVCTPSAAGSYRGVLNLLVLNKEIYREAKPIVDRIPHTIIIADRETSLSDACLYGTPRAVGTAWHASLTRLTLVYSVYGIGKMTPDTFDIVISHHGKAQWRHLKRLIGIWPDVRAEPLQQIWLELRPSSLPAHAPKYHADLIRIIRNFKRTHVWAETGSCRGGRNASLLLPVTRAFNEARRHWVQEADFANNLLVRYGAHKLGPLATPDTALRNKWNVMPTEDTSRTDAYYYPPLSAAEEKYIESKMVRRDADAAEATGSSAVVCDTCLACFDDRGGYMEHLRRGGRR